MTIYPGIKKIGHVEPFRLYPYHRLSCKILLFVFEDPAIEPTTAREIFERRFSGPTSLVAFRINQSECQKHDGNNDNPTSAKPLVIEALFADKVEYQKILKIASAISSDPENQPNIQKTSSNAAATDSSNNLLHGMHVYSTAPRDPPYMVYVIANLPLDSPLRARNIVRAAVIGRIVACFSISGDNASNYLIDVLVDDSSKQANGKSSHYYDGKVCFIVKFPRNLEHLWNRGSQVIFVYNMLYTLSQQPYKFYFYCQNCSSLDFHDTADCPDLAKRVNK